MPAPTVDYVPDFEANPKLQKQLEQTFHNAGKVLFLIDGANYMMMQDFLNVRVDLRKFRVVFNTIANVSRFQYFMAQRPELSENGTPSSVSLRPTDVKLIRWLEENGYSVVTKTASLIPSDNDQRTDESKPRGPSFKCNMDLELAGVALCETDQIDTIVFVTGDGDFLDTVRRLKARGKRVIVLSTQKRHAADTLHPHGRGILSEALRRASDMFIDLMDLMPLIEMVPNPDSQ